MRGNEPGHRKISRTVAAPDESHPGMSATRKQAAACQAAAWQCLVLHATVSAAAPAGTVPCATHRSRVTHVKFAAGAPACPPPPPPWPFRSLPRFGRLGRTQPPRDQGDHGVRRPHGAALPSLLPLWLRSECSRLYRRTAPGGGLVRSAHLPKRRASPPWHRPQSAATEHRRPPRPPQVKLPSPCGGAAGGRARGMRCAGVAGRARGLGKRSRWSTGARWLRGASRLPPPHAVVA